MKISLQVVLFAAFAVGIAHAGFGKEIVDDNDSNAEPSDTYRDLKNWAQKLQQHFDEIDERKAKAQKLAAEKREIEHFCSIQAQSF